MITALTETSSSGASRGVASSKEEYAVSTTPILTEFPSERRPHASAPIELKEMIAREGDANPYGLDEDGLYWWQTAAPALSNLMTHAGTYTPEQHASNMRFLAEHIVPTFGPRPATAKCMPLLTGDHSPFEPSWNFSTRGKTTVRFTFEPLGATAGSPEDPFAQAVVPAVLPDLAAQAKDADTRWFTQFTEALFLRTPEQVAAAKRNMPSFLPGRAPQCFVAFDLDGADRAMKAYFFPVLSFLAAAPSGPSCEEISFDTIRALEPCGAQLAPAADALQRYLRDGAPEPCPVEMLAIDCVAPEAGARVKVYARTESNAWSVVRHVYTLGGLLEGDETTMAGLAALKAIWHLLLGETEPMADESRSKAPRESHTRHKGVCYGFEMVPGKALPEVKVYVPAWNYASCDAAVARKLADVFRAQGWDAAADDYERAVRDAFPRADLDGPAYTHTYISFAYTKKKGVYMTMYYSASGMSVY